MASPSFHLLSRLGLAILVSAAAMAGAPGPGAVPPLALAQGWKFQPGDDLAYAAPAFDDAKWVPIATGLPWEKLGYPKLGDLAWYRIRFTLPEAMRWGDALKEGVKLFLGRIGDCDQTFLNGQIIGSDGIGLAPGTAPDAGFTGLQDSFRTLDRVYVIPAGDPRLKWGQENVLALRVRQTDDEGGLLSSGQNLAMASATDLVAMDASCHSFEFKGTAPGKTFRITNRARRHALRAVLRVHAMGAVSGSQLLDLPVKLALAPGASRACAFQLPATDEAAAITYSLRIGKGTWVELASETSPYLLTPPAPAAPRINGPVVYGARPGHPFLFAIPASGTKPMTYGARGLPAGLSVDIATGIIQGSVAVPGTYPVELAAHNNQGEARRKLDLVVGPGLALTPPMGWNSWNCWGLAVNEEKVVASARTFIDQGLQDHGWSFVNIDDGWEIPEAQEPKRDEQGRILVNGKFPDLARLGTRLHQLGLKFGIYSSPGPLTCGHHTGSYGHELEDARSYAAWGVDYLKYDWCSYGRIAKDRSLPELMKPYQTMRASLDRVDRDIVYSLCQYGMGKVWAWGGQVGGQLWRTTGDIEDTWESLSDIGFKQVEDAPFAGPGHWNDPDMLVVGQVGWGPSLHASRLTPDEQYTHLSLWSMLSAPLLIGCDLATLDAFTLNLLTNDEVLAIDQDPLGRQATPRQKVGDFQVWVKPLQDGGFAIAAFNLGAKAGVCPLDLAALGVPGDAALRDCWRQKDLGRTRAVKVPSHGVLLLRTAR